MSESLKGQPQKRKQYEVEALPHMDALLRTALRMTKNQSDAEDLVQETMVKAYRFWDKFESGSNCRAWLFKIMTNIFINEYRSKSRTPVSVNMDDIDDNFLGVDRYNRSLDDLTFLDIAECIVVHLSHY